VENLLGTTSLVGVHGCHLAFLAGMKYDDVDKLMAGMFLALIIVVAIVVWFLWPVSAI